MNVYARIAIILVLQTVALFGLIGMRQDILSAGTPILLEAQCINECSPEDWYLNIAVRNSPFRGDHVQLQYTINKLNLWELDGDSDYHRRDDIFITLEQQGKYWQAVAAHRRRPDVVDGQVVLKGRVTRQSRVNSEDKDGGQSGDSEDEEGGQSRVNSEDKEGGQSGDYEQVYVEYPIEDYFVSREEGIALAEAIRSGQVDVRVAVDERGRAGILAVQVDEVERRTEALF